MFIESLAALVANRICAIIELCHVYPLSAAVVALLAVGMISMACKSRNLLD